MINPYFFNQDPDVLDFTIYELFEYYNNFFFAGALQKCSVKWTNRMTQCAGTCKYEGFGSSTITLSEPLLKYRNSNEVKETLLHEMIHAYLFLTNPRACQSQGGHGPQFQKIMKQINAVTNFNITIYHSFHNQVQLYKNHIWRCNGQCKDKPPFYGYVKRSMNRKPQPADKWWKQHQRKCGGQFIKIKSPTKSEKKRRNNSKQSVNKLNGLKQNSKGISKQKKPPKKIKWKSNTQNSNNNTLDNFLKNLKQQNDKSKRLEKQKSKQKEKLTKTNIFSKPTKTLEQLCKQSQRNN